MAFFKRLALLSCLIGVSCNQSRAATSARGDEAKQPVAASGSSLKTHPLADGVLRVWPIGDSITEGVEGGYRGNLYKLLRARDIDVDYVGTLRDSSTKVSEKEHDGHPGFTISNAQENFDVWTKSVPEPDVVLMMLGTNDFAWWTNVTVAEHHGYFVKFVDHLLERLPHSVVVVATIPPQSPKVIEDVRLDRQKMTDDFNNMVRRWVPAQPSYGKRLFLADAARELRLSDLSDGIHPSKEGHAKLAKVWLKAMDQVLAQKKQP
ncbi:MAG TPA: GDSL-type esterase/lipase family protein [Polyangiaceae bacterium]|jgi:lysophospholipase L1-like esterase|nr:GDSL-type esterase/lipase family protein [Polyangiaceae bacterium]